jgi:enoyl-CoA hydratase
VKLITGLEAVQYGLANHAYSDEDLLENAYTYWQVKKYS